MRQSLRARYREQERSLCAGAFLKSTTAGGAPAVRHLAPDGADTIVSRQEAFAHVLSLRALPPEAHLRWAVASRNLSEVDAILL